MRIPARERTRQVFDRELEAFDSGVAQIATMVEDAVLQSTEAIVNGDQVLATQVISRDREINQLRRDLESEALMMIATQSPMAGDLRRILGGLHIVTDLERVGDHAVSIADISLRISGDPRLEQVDLLPELADVAVKMLRASVGAFMTQDETVARDTIRRDDLADTRYRRISESLFAQMSGEESSISNAVQLLSAAHHLERVADHATNVCENAIFVATGLQGDWDDSIAPVAP